MKRWFGFSSVLWLLGCAACLGAGSPILAQDFSSNWQPMAVPGAWEDNAKGQLAKYHGFAWFSCWVKVPADWQGSDLALSVEKVQNVHEVFWNGARVGGVGSFPPGYRDSTATANSYTIPEKIIKGGPNFLAIRVFNSAGKGGFLGTAPAVIHETLAISLQGTWEFRTGDNADWAKSPGDLPKDITVFTKVVATTSLPAPALAVPKGLTPAEAARSFTVPADLRIDQVLAEPVVRQPLSINFDEKGRLWVVQYLQYPNPAGLKVVSRDIFWRAVYDKVPPPPPNHFHGLDKITIHEDTHGDGVFDKHTTFVDGLNIATSALRGRGGVWVLNPPYLLFYPTRDNADQPTGDPVVHLEGFGLEDTHSVANSLHWGPDGWLYGAHGSTVSSHIKRPGDKAHIAHMIGQHIWRYHPEKKRFEIFGEGGGNAFGVEIDKEGRVFSGHNGGNTRGFHYVQGAYYRKGFEKHGQLSNPFAFGFFESMKHHDAARFSHTFVIYEGDGMPEPYQGRLFAVLPLQGQVMLSAVMPDRSSLQTKDLGPVVTSKDPWFRPVDIRHGPDGGVYIADFSDANIAHLRHFEGQIDKDSGRIYRLIGKNTKLLAPFDLGKKSTPELIDLLRHDNRWFRETALRLLGDRRDESARPILRKLVLASQGQLALEALWALNLSGGFTPEIAEQTLSHSEARVRAWTVRLLGEDCAVGAKMAVKLADLARDEKDVTVRCQLACSARRLPAAEGLPIVRELLTHDADAGDIHQPLLLWWALEANCAKESAQVLDLLRDTTLWRTKLVEEAILPRLMRRFAAAGAQKDLHVCVELFRLAPSKKHGHILLKGFEEGSKGRTGAGLPAELLEEIAKLGGGSIAFAVRQGQAEAVAQALAMIQNGKTPLGRREELAALFGEVRQPTSVPVLLAIATGKEPSRLRKTALTALQSYDEDRIGAAMVKLFPSLSGDLRDAAETLLVSRRTWGMQLLAAVAAGAIEPRSIATTSLKKLLLHRDPEIAGLVKKHWGEVRGATTLAMQQDVDRLLGVVRSGTGNPYPGKKLFVARCASCHALHGQGGTVGPDLTPYKRDEIATLLLNIVNPSAEIREGYENQVIATAGGRILTGIVLEKDARVLVLATADGQKIVLPREDVADISAAGVSLMPEGLLGGLNDQEVRDLMAYLRSGQPLNER
ncbi:MAG TPA: PVC-type heme-binding CxxCH protein [Gemmataceae bacterium]|nr:PVC-type heme-binding CxxCH protein [Gemmataceae bacterium]